MNPSDELRRSPCSRRPSPSLPRGKHWPAAQNAYASEGRGALVIDLTTRLDTGHPFLYAPKANIIAYVDPDALRMVNQYNPQRELVIILLKSEERASTYRLQPPVD